MSSSIRIRLLGRFIRVEVGIVLPFAVFPLGRSNEGTVLAEFQGKIVEWIWAKCFCFFISSLDVVNMDADYSTSSSNTLKNLISHPSPGPSA